MPTTSAGPASAAVTGTITVLRAAAMFDGVSPALIVAPSVVIADERSPPCTARPTPSLLAPASSTCPG